MKQLTIVSPSGRIPEGVLEILRRDAVSGIATWSAMASYISEQEVHEEFREGTCLFIVTVVPEEAEQQLVTDLLRLDQRLPGGHRFAFWLADVARLHHPWGS